MKPDDRAKGILIRALPFILLFLLGTRLGAAVRLAPGENTGSKILNAGAFLPEAFILKDGFLEVSDLVFSLVLTFFFYIVWKTGQDGKKKLREGLEFGRARFGGNDEAKNFMDIDSRKNMILTKTESLALYQENILPKYRRNANVLVWGGSGSGKTRCFIKPNIMQMNCNYIVTDPKGELIRSCGGMLRKAGYEVKVFNTVDFKKTLKYNPFEYIETEDDIARFATMLIENTKGGGQPTDDFWIKAETLLYISITALMKETLDKRDVNFGSFLNFLMMLSGSQKGEKLESYFEEAERKASEKGRLSYAATEYALFLKSAGQTRSSINISCAARMAPFNVPGVRKALGGSDEIRLMDFAKKKGSRPQALFLIMSDTSPTYSFLMSMIYSQALTSLMRKADSLPGGALPVPTRLLIDEAANIGKIPNLDKILSVVRSRNISVSLVFQTQSQIKGIYKDEAGAIAGNCDSELYLGGGDMEGIRMISEKIGKETIDMAETSKSTGNSPSFTQNFRKTGRSLMTPDDILSMDGGKCILFIRGTRPFYSDKYDIKTNPRYGMLDEGGAGPFDYRSEVILKNKVIFYKKLHREDRWEG